MFFELRSPSRRRTVLAGGIVLAVISTTRGDRPVDGERNAAPPDAIFRVLAAGHLVAAERLAEAHWSGTQRRFGSDSLELAGAADVVVEIAIARGRSGADQTLALANRAVQAKERTLGAEHLEVARSLRNLASVLSRRGEAASAVALHERALATRRRLSPPFSPVVADSLTELAYALILSRRLSEARRALDEVLSILERVARADPSGVARALELRGRIEFVAGSYREAEVTLTSADQLWLTIAADHPALVFTAEVRGGAQFLRGNHRAARETWSRALGLAEQRLGSQHPVVSVLLRLLGAAAWSAGNLAEARALRQRALTVAEGSLAPCDLERVAPLSGLAVSAQFDGEYAEGRRLHRLAISAIQRCYGAEPTGQAGENLATLLSNDSLIAVLMGETAEAIELQQRAVALWTRSLGVEHPFVARGIDALAGLFAERADFDEARRLYERALAIRRKALGENHPQVAATLASLATVSANQGQLSRALAEVEEAVAFDQLEGFSDDPEHLARVLEIRASIQRRTGQLERARASLAEALASQARLFGEHHPSVAQARALLASADFARRDSGAALRGALESERVGLEHLRLTVRSLPERPALSYAAKRPRGLDLALSIAASGAGVDPIVLLDALIRSRALVLDELAVRTRVVMAGDTRTAALNASVTKARQRFANLTVRSLQEPVAKDLLDEARTQKEDAERTLAEQSADARAEATRASAGVDEIRQALPAGSALVSFVQYQRTPRGDVSGTRPRVPAMAALVMRADTPQVSFVRLGPSAAVDELVSAWRTQAAGTVLLAGGSRVRAERDYRTASTRLRRAVWDPLRSHVANVDRILVVPDGMLNVVNLAALTEDDGRSLIETQPVMHYLSTERDLIATGDQIPTSRTLLAVGGPAFDGEGAAPVAAQTRGTDCAGATRLQFAILPGALAEVDAIGRLWPTGATGVTVLSGPAASETAVKQAVAGQRVVHLATHGFFVGADCAPTPAAGSRGVGGLSKGPGATPASNPLQLSGLAFAGANRRAAAGADEDDGILTAEEVASLNLSGVEWAVLSACDTGVGEVRAGEGVFGLRRAFQIAGARTVIMSLWSVDDQATRDWMRALYAGRFQQKLSTADAVRNASLTLLRERRAAGQGTHPFYWAAFVAAGDWR